MAVFLEKNTGIRRVSGWGLGKENVVANKRECAGEENFLNDLSPSDRGVTDSDIDGPSRTKETVHSPSSGRGSKASMVKN